MADACQQRGGPQHAVLPFDLKADFATLEAAAAEADTAFGGGGVDVLIHNAGARFRLVDPRIDFLARGAAACPWAVGIGSRTQGSHLC